MPEEFEYLVQPIDPMTVEQEQIYLNKAGAEGWEVTGVVMREFRKKEGEGRTVRVVHYFKKRKSAIITRG